MTGSSLIEVELVVTVVDFFGVRCVDASAGPANLPIETTTAMNKMLRMEEAATRWIAPP